VAQPVAADTIRFDQGVVRMDNPAFARRAKRYSDRHRPRACLQA
jgi:hypothetical protein